MAVVSKSVRIDEELWHKARMKAMAEKKTMQELIAELLQQYLKKVGGGDLNGNPRGMSYLPPTDREGCHV
jgi:hypothetical protein